MQKIHPFLWFDHQAQEAILFYTSVFKNSSVKSLQHYPEGGPMPAGTLMWGTFEIEGLEFHAMNAGPTYQFSPAISFFVNCETQGEVDDLWAKLTEGGKEQPCGWLQDKFGVSWQIIPRTLSRLMHDPDPRKAGAVMHAMMQMTKIEIAKLQEAYDSVE